MIQYAESVDEPSTVSCGQLSKNGGVTEHTTANFGCCERRTMASQPSLYDEERNRLRLRAWEQRNQETSQAKELNPDNVPLFGEPYKTNKGDELSTKIQRMLGNYEDVNNPNPFATEPLPASTYVTFSQSDQGQPNTEKSAKPPFHDQVHYTSTQNQAVSSSSSYPSQAIRASTAPSSPNPHGRSSVLPKASMNHNQGSHSAQQKKGEAFSDLRERMSLPQEMSAPSPEAKSLPFLHSTEDNTEPKDTLLKDAFDWHQLQEPTDHPSPTTTDVSTVNLKQSPKDGSMPQASKGSTLPSQTFPPLLSSKQPSVVMTQKPTAYVRPMDGQDQVVNESPELKPSPEPYAPLQELVINKSDHGKTKTLPQFLETRTTETLCVEDILKEMAHALPPLLTAIHITGSDKPSKSPAPAKPRFHENHGYSSTDPSQLNLQSSSLSFEAAHSSGVESASSSDSEPSSTSDSDSDSATEKPPQVSSSKNEPEAAARGNWLLGKWLSPSQQNSSCESQGAARDCGSPSHKQLQTTQTSKHSSVEVIDPIRESKPPLSSHQKELSGNLPKPQQCSERSHDNNIEGSQNSPSVNLNGCSSSGNLSRNIYPFRPVKVLGSDQTETALSVKPVEVVATREKDPCFTDRPKVKTKFGHCNKSKVSNDAKRNNKRTFKHTSLDKRKADEATLVESAGQCPNCSAKHPNPCSCHTQSAPLPDRLSPASPLRITCKPKSEIIFQKGAKMPHKLSSSATHKHSQKTRSVAKVSRDLRQPPRSLLVKIDLSLLSRIPVTVSGVHQVTTHNTGPTALVIEQQEKGSVAPFKHPKTSKKSVSQNVEVDDKTLPKKKRKLEKKTTSSTNAPIKLERPSNPPENKVRKKPKKKPAHLQQPPNPKDTNKDSKSHKHSEETRESRKEVVKNRDSSKHKKGNGKHKEHPHNEKKPPPSSQPTREAAINRPLLKLEDRQYPVKHYIKEAKRLKHKADAESDKLSKAFNYLDAAMYFIESGIAMERDPQISMSSYTMFAETVELLKFVLKLKNSVDPSAPPSEKDFLALCLKCQSLLQMAMFHHKHKTALKYSKTLTDHFNNSQATQDPSVLALKGANTPSPMPNVPSPASTSSSSKPSGSGLIVGSTVVVPQAIEQVAFTYVNITTLFLSAHDLWEQAEELAHRGSGMLTELDTVMGPLSLTSSVSSLVRYTRQGVLWLRLDSQKVK
ncbi:AF4/FMR2 family member 1 [Aulostomus maculatus]